MKRSSSRAFSGIREDLKIGKMKATQAIEIRKKYFRAYLHQRGALLSVGVEGNIQHYRFVWAVGRGTLPHTRYILGKMLVSLLIVIG